MTFPNSLPAQAVEPGWTVPGAYEVIPNVYRIPLPLPNDGLRAVNVYLLMGDKEVALIDGGQSMPESRQALEQALNGVGASIRDVSDVYVTHLHSDHFTQAVAIRAESGARVHLGIGERAGFEFLLQADQDGFSFPQEAQLAQAGATNLVGAWRRVVQRPSIEQRQAPDRWLRASEIEVSGYRLEVIPTPGHTRGHVVFADWDRELLFAGDHLLPTITPSIGFEPVVSDYPLRDFLSSLALMTSRPDLTLLPAHGAVRPSVHSRARELAEHHRIRLRSIEDATASDEEVTAFEVAHRLKWTRRLRDFDGLDPFNAILATLETLAHMELLAVTGRLSRRLVGPEIRYRKTAAPGAS